MSDIREWSITAADNDASPPDGFPELMDKADVNDAAREVMAAVARDYQAPEWKDYTFGSSSISRDSDTQLTIVGVEIASLLKVFARCRVVGATTLDTHIASVADSAGDTIVTIQAGDVLPSGPLTAFYQNVTATARQAAFYDVGAASGKLVDYDDFETTAFTPQGSGNALDADTLDGKHYADFDYNAAKLLMNGGFRRWQEASSWSAPASETYVADQWKLATEGSGSVDVARDTTVPTGSRYSAKLTWNSANEMAALYQFIEADDCGQAIGRNVSLSFMVKGGSTRPANVRAAIVSWNGSADAITSPLVTAWPATGANLTLAAGATIESAASLVLDGTWQQFTLENITIDTGGAVNVGVIVWSDDDSVASGSELWITQVQLEIREIATPYRTEPLAELFSRTHRYFCKTFDESVTPADAAGLTGALYQIANSAAALSVQFFWSYPETMRATPTVTLYNPSTSSASKIHNITGAVEVAGTAASIGSKGTEIHNTGAAGSNHTCAVHATADARFF